MVTLFPVRTWGSAWRRMQTGTAQNHTANQIWSYLIRNIFISKYIYIEYTVYYVCKYVYSNYNVLTCSFSLHSMLMLQLVACDERTWLYVEDRIHHAMSQCSSSVPHLAKKAKATLQSILNIPQHKEMHRMIYNMNLLTQKSKNGSTKDSLRITPFVITHVDAWSLSRIYKRHSNHHCHERYKSSNVLVSLKIMANCLITSCPALVVRDFFNVCLNILPPRSCNEKTVACWRVGDLKMWH